MIRPNWYQDYQEKTDRVIPVFLVHDQGTFLVMAEV